jgi:hypothetical protein
LGIIFQSKLLRAGELICFFNSQDDADHQRGWPRNSPATQERKHTAARCIRENYFTINIDNIFLPSWQEVSDNIIYSYIYIYIRYIIDFPKVILNLQNTESKVIRIVTGEILLNILQVSSVGLPAQALNHPQG